MCRKKRNRKPTRSGVFHRQGRTPYETKQLNVTVSAHTVDTVRRIAQRHGVTFSDVVAKGVRMVSEIAR